jgi:hypothetical protein
MPKPFALTGAEVDDHFGFPIHAAVEEVNKYYKKRLFEIFVGRLAHQRGPIIALCLLCGLSHWARWVRNTQQ